MALKLSEWFIMLQTFRGIWKLKLTVQNVNMKYPGVFHVLRVFQVFHESWNHANTTAIQGLMTSFFSSTGIIFNWKNHPKIFFTKFCQNLCPITCRSKAVSHHFLNTILYHIQLLLNSINKMKYESTWVLFTVLMIFYNTWHGLLI